MTRAELVEALEVERFAPPPPRPPRTARCDPPTDLTPEQQAENRRRLADALDGTEAAVLPLRRKGAAA